jgi:hypothetical protein
MRFYTDPAEVMAIHWHMEAEMEKGFTILETVNIVRQWQCNPGAVRSLFLVT